jgi:hypothetical protein
MRGKNTLDRRLPVGQRQREPVRDVRLDRQHEGVCVVTVEEPHCNLCLATEFSRPQPVHAVDDSHGGPMDDDRWQLSFGGRERLYVLRILPREARRVSDDGEEFNRDADYRRIRQLHVIRAGQKICSRGNKIAYLGSQLLAPPDSLRFAFVGNEATEHTVASEHLYGCTRGNLQPRFR